MKAKKADLPILLFETAEEWRSWLSKNHRTSEGIWMQIAKKGSKASSATYAEALDEALCHGWIDGQKQTFDQDFFLIRFTPRRARSVWSKINITHVDRLIKANKMTTAGLEEVERAKKDGRWDQAYDSPKNAKVPEDFLAALKKNKKAATFFATLDKSNIYSIVWRLQTAKKPETRLARMNAIIAMLAKGEKLHANGKKPAP